jgi:hypothetical protein
MDEDPQTPAALYTFRVESEPDARVLLNHDERQQVLAWLSGTETRSLALEGLQLRLARATIGGDESHAPESGVAVQGSGFLVGISETTAASWASDLGQGNPGTYVALRSSDTVPINDDTS